MENKINIAELLKDCPRGMELDCTMFDDVTLLEVTDSRFPIKIAIGDNRYRYLTETGGYANDIIPESKCIIFPKGKTTWEGFVPPVEFKNGDIIYNQCIKATAIFYKQINGNTISHCFLNVHKELKIQHEHCKLLYDWRLANEEEQEKLVDAIKAHGYKWNVETKALEQLVNKFDIATLKPFGKVLVRGNAGQKWTHDFFGFMDKDKGFPFVCVGHYVIQCIPYEGNEHLLGKTDDCDEYYKTWTNEEE